MNQKAFHSKISYLNTHSLYTNLTRTLISRATPFSTYSKIYSYSKYWTS